MTYWERLGFTLTALAGVFALALAITVVMAIEATHVVDHYYVAETQHGGHLTCAWGNVDWAFDERVFCTDDPYKALEVARRGNVLINLHKPTEY